MKNLMTAVLIILFGTLKLTAQNGKPVLDAFAGSYVAEADRDYAKAIEYLQKLYDRQSYEMNLRLGWLYYLKGSYPESVHHYKIATDLKPLAIEPKFGLVLPAAAMGNWENVRKQYLEILTIDPQNTLANYRLGYIYYNIQNYTDAYKHFEKVVNLYPFDYDGLLMYAWTNFRLGKLREAKVLFNKVLLYSPDDPSALEGLLLIQ